MPQIILSQLGAYYGIHPFPRVRANDKIAVWGPLRGGNLSLKNSLVLEAPALGAAFMARGAQPWVVPNHVGIPHSTPHGGANFYATLTGITRQDAIQFLAEHGYELVQENGDAVGANQAGVAANAPERGPGNEGMAPLNLGSLFEALLGPDWYQKFVEIFEAANRFRAVRAGTTAELANRLPAGNGVYVVRDEQKQSKSESILYVGMVGTLKRNGAGLVVTGGGFPARVQRYTPYCYSSEGPYANHFEFGPNATGDAIVQLPHDQRYKQHYPLRQIVTDCFILTNYEQSVAPAFLEAALLQCCVSLNGDLPPGNQAF